MAGLTVATPKSKVPACRSGASADVLLVFAELVGAAPADHFQPTDAALIEQYATAILMAQKAYAQLERDGPVIDGKASPWIVVLEKANRASVALAARLRLCPQARMDSWSASRKQGPAPSAYEMMEMP